MCQTEMETSLTTGAVRLRRLTLINQQVPSQNRRQLNNSKQKLCSNTESYHDADSTKDQRCGDWNIKGVVLVIMLLFSAFLQIDWAGLVTIQSDRRSPSWLEASMQCLWWLHLISVLTSGIQNTRLPTASSKANHEEAKKAVMPDRCKCNIQVHFNKSPLIF